MEDGTRNRIPVWSQWDFWLVVALLALVVGALGYSLLNVPAWLTWPSLWFIAVLAFLLGYLVLDFLLNIAVVEFFQSRAPSSRVGVMIVLLAISIVLIWLWWQDIGSRTA